MKASASSRERAERARRARLRRHRRRRERLARRPSILRALTTSTLALPGIAGSASAETPSESYTAAYNYSRYSEEELSGSDVSVGSETERYEIEVHQFRLEGPLTDRIDFSLDLAHETMTGATPWYVQPPNTSEGETDPRVVMTGASVEDARTDGLLKGTYYLDRGTASLSTGVSAEDDYLSFNGGIEGTRSYNEKNTTLSGGLGFSYDLIEPTDGGTDNRPKSEDKQAISVFGGLSQVLGRNTQIQSTVTYQHMRGFLSDPYKQVFVGGPLLPDTRPDDRNQLIWLTRLRRHVGGLYGSLHADYSFYLDDWGINAHTIDVAWYQNLFDLMRLIPSVRYYSQSQADFYAPWYDSPSSDGLYSSDYRLSPYGALSWRVRAETRFQTWQLDWMLNVGYEKYESAGDLALKSVDLENPALVSFDMFSVGFSTRF